MVGDSRGVGAGVMSKLVVDRDHRCCTDHLRDQPCHMAGGAPPGGGGGGGGAYHLEVHRDVLCCTDHCRNQPCRKSAPHVVVGQVKVQWNLLIIVDGWSLGTLEHAQSTHSPIGSRVPCTSLPLHQPGCPSTTVRSHNLVVAAFGTFTGNVDGMPVDT